MENENLVFRNERPLRIPSYYHGSSHFCMILKGRRIKLGTQNKYVIPSGHLHLRSHGPYNAFPRNRHLMNIFHAAACRILTRKSSIISQVQLDFLFFHFILLFLFFLKRHGLFLRLPAYRICLQFLKALSFLIPRRKYTHRRCSGILQCRSSFSS